MTRSSRFVFDTNTYFWGFVDRGEVRRTISLHGPNRRKVKHFVERF